jgi:hypothetical protein
MKIYHLLQIIEHGYLVVFSTDSDTLNDLAREVKSLWPSCRVKESQQIESEPRVFDRAWGIEINRLQKKHVEVLWYLVSQLAGQGWEPFAVFPRNDLTYYHFRKEITSE